MNISAGLLSHQWLWTAHMLFALVLVCALWRLPWTVLLGNRRLQHLFYGTTVGLMLLWTMRAGISPGLGIHFLGMTTLTLMFGWDLAVLSATLALIGMTLVGHESWEAFSVNGLCSIVLPAWTSYAILRVVEAKFPKNFFVYLFLCAFLGAAVAAAVSGLSTALLLWFDGVYDWSRINREYVILLPLIMLPEGLLNGIVMTAMMVFYPDWIRTFNARAYIDDQ